MSEYTPLGLFDGYDRPEPRFVNGMYERSQRFNDSINLDETVKVNENFYVGKQWEGVESNGLPTITMNFLKRTVGFTVANVSVENIKAMASPMDATPETSRLIDPVRIINEEFERIVERSNFQHKTREATRNAAVDGDGCLYTYWDPSIKTGYGDEGAIAKEVLLNTDVRFGNPHDREVQTQPWILIRRRMPLREMRMRAKRNGIKDWETIHADDAYSEKDVDSSKNMDDEFCTMFLVMWRDDETREIWAYECTPDVEIKAPWNMSIHLYPICWLNWDYVKDSYHGQAMITGLIPNQIAENKLWSMTAISLMRMAFPKVIYDKTRIKQWDNRVGGAIPVNGGDVNAVARILDPAAISPQVSQVLELLVSQTQESLGATAVALGDTRPDNTSAIIALQRAASTPHEIIKQNINRMQEDSFRIDLEFMTYYYGTRKVDVEVTPQMEQIYQFAGMPVPEDGMTVALFDFGQLADHAMSIKLDVGASSYYSEIASIQTMDNLLQLGHITAAQYVERIPDGYIPSRRKLLNELRQKEKQAMMAQGMMPEGMPPDGMPQEDMDSIAAPEQKPDIPTTRGYSGLARKINASNSTQGMV